MNFVLGGIFLPRSGDNFVGHGREPVDQIFAVGKAAERRKTRATSCAPCRGYEVDTTRSTGWRPWLHYLCRFAAVAVRDIKAATLG